MDLITFYLFGSTLGRILPWTAPPDPSQSGPSPTLTKNQICGRPPRAWDFPASRTVRRKHLRHQPPCLWCFWLQQPKLTPITLRLLRTHPNTKTAYISSSPCATHFTRGTRWEPHSCVEEGATPCSILQVRGLRPEGEVDSSQLLELLGARARFFWNTRLLPAGLQGFR